MFGIGKKTVKKDYTEKVKKMHVTCPKCKQVFDGAAALETLYICPECGAYMNVSAKARITMLVDEGTFEPWFKKPKDENPLQLEGYEEKLEAARKKSGASEAVTIGKAKIQGEDVVLGVCDPSFMIGSMGHEMGERITAAFERAIEEKLSVVLYCCSGGARMQEAIISLMQMEKTAAAVKLHSEAGLFYCSVLTDPTMGGVTASFATLGDIILAEPGARVGFAGPRVIQQTIGQTLPDGFQTPEFLLAHGMIDGILERKDARETLAYLLKIHRLDKTAGKKLEVSWEVPPVPGTTEEEKSAWEKVKMCRSTERATAMDYIEHIFENFYELHGDRCFRDDRALVGGLAMFEKMPVTILADLRGTDFTDRIERNFGMPMPDGYRKAVRLMKQAEKFGRPVVTFINTSGAFCGVDAEERGQGEAIARSIMEMSALKVPVLCILIGEGGSGGALATAVGNEVWMLENSTYAILSPEGYSSILWKTEQRAEEAASVMKLTAQELYKLEVIDRILPEFGGATSENADEIADNMKEIMKAFFKKYSGMSGKDIAKDRYNRFRKF
ncbi:MAG: acetyl-CoA carboxylase carboxyltransferase subunit alpha [Lachnospiraceae bacterium]|nr:acetyl-CoA carboxylase carboxyltransferase subunit alpha [Lachnospiraceae bacterium]MBP3610994.1 acetyl-CoA carboxylase carboxyltransferase subunit alpha [Lachnospiraceae bacterium]